MPAKRELGLMGLEKLFFTKCSGGASCAPRPVRLGEQFRRTAELHKETKRVYPQGKAQEAPEVIPFHRQAPKGAS